MFGPKVLAKSQHYWCSADDAEGKTTTTLNLGEGGKERKPLHMDSCQHHSRMHKKDFRFGKGGHTEAIVGQSKTAEL